jgi:hypothetical protein
VSRERRALEFYVFTPSREPSKVFERGRDLGLERSDIAQRIGVQQRQLDQEQLGLVRVPTASMAVANAS